MSDNPWEQLQQRLRPDDPAASVTLLTLPLAVDPDEMVKVNDLGHSVDVVFGAGSSRVILTMPTLESSEALAVAVANAANRVRRARRDATHPRLQPADIDWPEPAA